MKICNKCHINKEDKEFHKDSSKNDGLNYYCKQCRKGYTSDKWVLLRLKEKCRVEKEWKRKQRYSNDIKYRVKKNLSRSFRSFFNGNKPCSIFHNYSLEEYVKHLELTMKPEYIGIELHIDHIIPQSLYNPENEEDVRKCWSPRNLRWLPAKENMSKSDSLDMSLIEDYDIADLLP